MEESHFDDPLENIYDDSNIYQKSGADQINWKEVNKSVVKTLEFLKKPYPSQVRRFLDWYEQKDRLAKIDSPEFKKWVISGIPKMNLIIRLMDQEIDKIEKILDKILTMPIPLSEKTKKTKVYYEGLRNVLQTIIDFIGCRNNFGLWYIGLLKRYSAIPQVKASAEYFEDVCLNHRGQMLNYRKH